MSKQKVVVIHTLSSMIGDFKEAFANMLPEIELVNIVDDSLLTEALYAGCVTNNARERYLHYAMAAEHLGAAAILNMCSSYSECVDLAKQVIATPIFKIDEPMAIQANTLGDKIAVITTAHCTIVPSCRLVERHGGADTIVTPYYAEGALDAVMKNGDRDKHDRLLLATAENAAAENDVLVLAQGSMARLVPLLSTLGKPVLSSMQSGILQLRQELALD